MSHLRELEERRAELGGLRSLLASAHDEIFEKPLLRTKIAAREQALIEIERNPSIAPEAELLLGGRGVVGSLGIDAKFAAQILESYQDMVSNHHGARLQPGMGDTGRRPGEQESKLFLTALPRGSFGLRLAQPQPHDFISAQQMSVVMDELTSLVDSAAGGDASFSQSVERFHPRVLVPLQRFLETLASRDASITLRSGSRQSTLVPEQVRAARTRVAATETVSGETTLQGIFRGVLLESWRFDFVPDGQLPISGALAESVAETEAQGMVRLCNQRCEAVLNVIQYRTHGALSRPTYELKRLRQIGV
ncbi:MAG: hypothetical protein V4773_30015 [Verrucomicrobiota bacterium]